jgi:hypothetical protein
MAIVPVTLFLLRLIVYCVPDLVNLVRQIDDKFSEKLKTHSGEANDGNGRRVDLSFIVAIRVAKPPMLWPPQVLGLTRESQDFPSHVAAFCRISEMRRRLRGEENRYGSKRSGVALRVGIQGLPCVPVSCRVSVTKTTVLRRRALGWGAQFGGLTLC